MSTQVAEAQNGMGGAENQVDNKSINRRKEMIEKKKKEEEEEKKKKKKSKRRRNKETTINKQLPF